MVKAKGLQEDLLLKKCFSNAIKMQNGRTNTYCLWSSDFWKMSVSVSPTRRKGGFTFYCLNRKCFKQFPELIFHNCKRFYYPFSDDYWVNKLWPFLILKDDGGGRKKCLSFVDFPERHTAFLMFDYRMFYLWMYKNEKSGYKMNFYLKSSNIVMQTHWY